MYKMNISNRPIAKYVAYCLSHMVNLNFLASFLNYTSYKTPALSNSYLFGVILELRRHLRYFIEVLITIEYHIEILMHNVLDVHQLLIQSVNILLGRRVPKLLALLGHCLLELEEGVAVFNGLNL